MIVEAGERPDSLSSIANPVDMTIHYYVGQHHIGWLTHRQLVEDADVFINWDEVRASIAEKEE